MTRLKLATLAVFCATLVSAVTTLKLSDGAITLTGSGATTKYQQGSGNAIAYTDDVLYIVQGDLITTTTNNIVIKSGTHAIRITKLDITTAGNTAPIDLSEGVNLTLIIRGTNTLESIDSQIPAIYCPPNTSLTITNNVSSSHPHSVLYATGSPGATGIGGRNEPSGSPTRVADSGAITIQGGEIYAQGGDAMVYTQHEITYLRPASAGIGGAGKWLDPASSTIPETQVAGALTSLTITGGEIHAAGGAGLTTNILYNGQTYTLHSDAGFGFGGGASAYCRNLTTAEQKTVTIGPCNNVTQTGGTTYGTWSNASPPPATPATRGQGTVAVVEDAGHIELRATPASNNDLLFWIHGTERFFTNPLTIANATDASDYTAFFGTITGLGANDTASKNFIATYFPTEGDYPLTIQPQAIKQSTPTEIPSSQESAGTMTLLNIAPVFTPSNGTTLAAITYEFGIVDIKVATSQDNRPQITLTAQVTTGTGTLGDTVQGTLQVLGGTTASTLTNILYTETNPSYTEGRLTLPPFDPGTNTIFTIRISN